MNNLGEIIEELFKSFQAESGREKLDEGETIVAICNDGVVELTEEEDTLKISATICRAPYIINKNIVGGAGK